MTPRYPEFIDGALCEAWLKTFGRPTPMQAEWFMQGNLHYAKQCAQHGGLSVEVLRKLKAIANGKQESKASAYRGGTKFVRMWKGEPHEVTMMADGTFNYRGSSYGSLSAIARHITGTVWSGNAFFGLNKVPTHGG